MGKKRSKDMISGVFLSKAVLGLFKEAEKKCQLKKQKMTQ